MNSTIIVALISFAGTVVGTAGGIMASSKLTAYRIEQLEKKVDKHNQIVERMAIAEERLKVVNHRVDDLEKEAEA